MALIKKLFKPLGDSLNFSDKIILIIVLLLFISGFTIYFVNYPNKSQFYIDDISFKLGYDSRWLELSVKSEADTLELKQFFINSLTVYNWSTDKMMIRKGEHARCILEFPWKMGEDHVIRLVTVDNQSLDVMVRAPIINPSLSLDLRDLKRTLTDGMLKVNIDYSIEGNGIDSAHVLIFVYNSFQVIERPLYIFIDPKYMSEEAVDRAEFIAKHLKSLNMTVDVLDYDRLEEVSRGMPRAILIIVNPLKDGFDRRLIDAAPSPLIDLNWNGYLRDDSKYGRSFLYDWMTDGGLILVTVGSNQPYKRVLYSDGHYKLTRDSFEDLDAHLFLTSVNGKESIIKGAGFLGDYSPVRISGSLGLSYREESYAFDKSALENYELSYYAYGEYKLNLGGKNLNLVLPVFIRVGKGGWLAMGDRDFWLSNEQLSHDLSLILLHSVWNSDWVPYGWYWDSGTSFHSGGGLIRARGSLETEMIPLNIIGEKLSIRVLCIAYSRDLERGIIVERVFEHQVQ